MSFKWFIYLCALCGGWAAFVTWAVVQLAFRDKITGLTYAMLVGLVLGGFLAAAIGAVDAILNAVGFQRIIRVFICFGIGLLGGVLGSLIGDTLYKTSGNQMIFLVIGWMIVGSFIGASIGVFDLLRAMTTKGDIRAPLNKTLNGVYGGLLGGFLGGWMFGFLYGYLNDRLPISNLTIGLVLLGLCIGLLIGLAQVILKEAWLKIEQGFRAGREVLVTKDEVTIGRGEGCDIGLFGDASLEKLHARVVLKNGRYFVNDANTPNGTFVNDRRIDRETPLKKDDIIRVGKCVLRFGERQKRK